MCLHDFLKKRGGKCTQANDAPVTYVSIHKFLSKIDKIKVELETKGCTNWAFPYRTRAIIWRSWLVATHLDFKLTIIFYVVFMW